MKKNFLFFLVFFACAMGASAQVPNNPLKSAPPVTKPIGDPNTTPNYMVNLMYYYDRMSENVRVPDSVLTVFKNYAALHNIEEKVAFKISTALRPIFNDNLTPRERIEVINFYRQIDAWDNIIPQSFYNESVKRLQKLY